mmetsp:Transcript_34755/g.68611  ORF Transcript_34755/g.68611 Transcript_34755/m.68611 type:complete len:105 (-) Transcript_34755:247-561(-)
MIVHGSITGIPPFPQEQPDYPLLSCRQRGKEGHRWPFSLLIPLPLEDPTREEEGGNFLTPIFPMVLLPQEEGEAILVHSHRQATTHSSTISTQHPTGAPRKPPQ